MSYKKLGTEEGSTREIELLQEVEQQEYLDQITKELIQTEETEEEEWVLEELEYKEEHEGISLDILMRRNEEEDGGDLVS